MEFGSDYVYVYEDVDFEYISDDEYEAGMNISNSESDDSDEDIEVMPSIPREPQDVVHTDSSERHVSALELTPPPPRKHQKRMVAKTHWRSAGRGSKRGSNKGSSSQNQHQRRVRQGDTNIVTVKFDKLVLPNNMHAGDPQSCTQCGAILSALSELKQEDDTKVWCCEFCDTRNILDIEDEEKPNNSDVTFMLEPALSTSASGPSGLDESLVVFCVDVSGSMCVTTEVPGHVELRGAQGLRRAQLLNRERSDQYLPRQNRNVTYVSRLQSVQAAIDHQLQEMTKDFPNRRVALVTFSNEVTVFGDGKTDPLGIVGDKLGNKDTLKSIATEQPFPESIKNTRQQLGQKLFELEEGGPTALGPALLIATTMAGKVRGSKVILCTDGLANVGMGKLDNFKSDDEKDLSSKFYDEISETAVENGVSISVVTIKGTDCKLVEIGKMADKTGGQVNIVDPLKLTQEFSTILANKIMATNVVATFILHKELFFFYEDSEESKVVKNVGNVTADSEISFEYGVRTKPAEEKKGNPNVPEKIVEVDETKVTDEEPNKMETDEQSEKDSDKPMDVDNKPVEAKMEEVKVTPGGSCDAGSQGAEGSSEQDKRKCLPFQLQIVYTDTEGAKALRVITQNKPITRERKVAETKAKVDVLARHTAMTTSKMAQEGMYTMGRERALMNQRVAWRHTRASNDVSSRPAYKSKFGRIKSMENYLNARQQSERASSGRTYSDEESDDENDERATDTRPPAPPGALKSVMGKGKSFLTRLKKKRSENTDDAGAVLVMKGKNAKSFFEDSDSD
ncbi:hypothetical protein ACF0H5_007818 [Mactra antiquata]